MAADPAVLLGGEAAGIVRQLRFLVHIDTAKDALAAPSGEGVGDFPAHPAASGDVYKRQGLGSPQPLRAVFISFDTAP